MIERRSGLSPRDFEHEYLRPQRPVILTDAIDHWPALRRWSPRRLAERFGPRPVVIDGERLSFNELVDRVERSSPEAPAPYLRNYLIPRLLPELLPEIWPLPACTHPNWLESPLFPASTTQSFVELYLGGRGATFPILHYDNLFTHAFLMQVVGRKEYVTFPHAQGPLLYPQRDVPNLSPVNVDAPDLARFPRFAEATPGTFELVAGETLFVPSGLWHTARILEPTITVSVNVANASNWARFSEAYVTQVARDRSPVFRRALARYLAGMARLQPLMDAAGAGEVRPPWRRLPPSAFGAA